MQTWRGELRVTTLIERFAVGVFVRAKTSFMGGTQRLTTASSSAFAPRAQWTRLGSFPKYRPRYVSSGIHFWTAARKRRPGPVLGIGWDNRTCCRFQFNLIGHWRRAFRLAGCSNGRTTVHCCKLRSVASHRAARSLMMCRQKLHGRRRNYPSNLWNFVRCRTAAKSSRVAGPI